MKTVLQIIRRLFDVELSRAVEDGRKLEEPVESEIPVEIGTEVESPTLVLGRIVEEKSSVEVGSISVSVVLLK